MKMRKQKKTNPCGFSQTDVRKLQNEHEFVRETHSPVQTMAERRD